MELTRMIRVLIQQFIRNDLGALETALVAWLIRRSQWLRAEWRTQLAAEEFLRWVRTAHSHRRLQRMHRNLSASPQ